MEPEVTIVVAALHHGSADSGQHGDEAIASLQGQDWPKDSIEVILLRDSTVPLASQKNFALKRARGEVVGFIDGGLKVHPSWLKESVKLLMEGWAFSTPWVLDEAGKETIFARGAMSFLGHALWPKEERSQGLRPVLFPCPVSFMVRKEAFLKVGGFDEDYQGSYEEVDLGWRLWLYGEKGVFVPQAIAFYQRPPSPLSASDEEIFRQEKNSLMTIIKNYEEKNLQRALSLSLLLLMRKAKDSEANMRCLKYLIDNIEALWARRQTVQKERRLEDEAIFSLSDTPLRWPNEENFDPESMGWFLGSTKSILSSFCHA